MRVVTKLAVAAIALSAYSTAASAAVNLDHVTGLSHNPGPGPGETIVWDFDSTMDTAHFSFTGNTYTASIPSVAAAPAGDMTTFAAAQPVGSGAPFADAIFSANAGTVLKSLSFDLGSLDGYNTLSFYHNGSLVRAFTGAELTDPNAPHGDQSDDFNNLREYFTFGASDGINRVVFSSTSPAFEFDNIAASIAGVPEPATWTMLILGFGFVGFMMRGNRQKTAVAVI